MLLASVRTLLWGFPMIALLVVVGGYFSVRTSLFQLHPLRLFRHTLGKLPRQKAGRRELLKSVCTALGGTVGAGSVTGVAYGIAIGGAGSVFWMWVSGFTGMALKYAEVYLAIRHRKKDANGESTGGTPYLLSDAGHPKLGALFALLCICASFGVGNLAQIGAVTQAAKAVGMRPLLCGILCAILLLAVQMGGKKRIGTLNLLLVPASAFLYLAAVLWILLLHGKALPGVLMRILREAFGFRPAFGGITGALLAKAMREGFARGVFSNEAGVGSSPLAHASSGQTDPQTQAEWGALEVVCDTFLVSTLTALALLCSGTETVPELFGLFWGNGGKLLFALLMGIFAFASILSWCYYSEVCLTYLQVRIGKPVYRVLASLAAGLGACIAMDALWAMADLLNALMILPNLYVLFRYRREVLYVPLRKERLSTCGILKKKKPSCARSTVRPTD